jgi:hypothetical protein
MSIALEDLKQIITDWMDLLKAGHDEVWDSGSTFEHTPLEYWKKSIDVLRAYHVLALNKLTYALMEIDAELAGHNEVVKSKRSPATYAGLPNDADDDAVPPPVEPACGRRLITLLKTTMMLTRAVCLITVLVLTTAGCGAVLTQNCGLPAPRHRGRDGV